MRLKPIIIIPARYNSSRFPGKMLEKLGDKTVLEQTIETGKRTGLPVYVATDDRQIADLCIRINQEYVMTSPDHKNGTERVAEAMVKLIDKHGEEFSNEFDYVINLQGDSPLIPDYVFSMMMEEYERMFAFDKPFDVITPTFRMNMETAERFLDCRAEGRAGGTTVVSDTDGGRTVLLQRDDSIRRKPDQRTVHVFQDSHVLSYRNVCIQARGFV